MFFSCSNQQVYTSYTPIHRLVRRGLQIDCNNIHNTDTSNMKTNSILQLEERLRGGYKSERLMYIYLTAIEYITIF